MIKQSLNDHRLLFFSNTSAGLPLAQIIPQTHLQSHQPQIGTIKPPIPQKTTTFKPSTVSIQLIPTSTPLIRRKPSIPTSSLAAKFTTTSHSNSSQSYTSSQHNTMYSSPHQWTKPSNHTPPPSMATQSPLSTISNLPVQSHIPIPYLQPYILNVPSCAPFSANFKFLMVETIDTTRTNS